MPPVLVYSVDFTNGSLQPTVDVNNWGNMVFGGSTTGALQRTFVDGGLSLTATRHSTETAGVSNSVYVVLPTGTLSRATRLQLHAEFDLPNATPDPTNAPIPPWAVALRVKLGGETDLPGDRALINVTCQFNQDGVKLADPRSDPTNAPIPPWAVALRVKLGGETDLPGDRALINVTCQFNQDGVKLADP